jgi:hypothetical protein
MEDVGHHLEIKPVVENNVVRNLGGVVVKKVKMMIGVEIMEGLVVILMEKNLRKNFI